MLFGVVAQALVAAIENNSNKLTACCPTTQLLRSGDFAIVEAERERAFSDAIFTVRL
jgi:hypothetical protein